MRCRQRCWTRCGTPATFFLNLMAITADPFPVCFNWLLAHPSPACLPARLSTRPSCLQLGIVHEWLGRPEKMQYQVVEATAARSASPVVLLHGVPPLPCAQQKGG